MWAKGTYRVGIYSASPWGWHFVKVFPRGNLDTQGTQANSSWSEKKKLNLSCCTLLDMNINSLELMLHKYWQYKPYLLVMEKWMNTIVALRDETPTQRTFNTRLQRVITLPNHGSPCSNKRASVSGIRSGSHKHHVALISQLKCFWGCYAIIPDPLGSSLRCDVTPKNQVRPYLLPRVHVTLTWVRWLIGWAL